MSLISQGEVVCSLMPRPSLLEPTGSTGQSQWRVAIDQNGDEEVRVREESMENSKAYLVRGYPSGFERSSVC